MTTSRRCRSRLASSRRRWRSSTRPRHQPEVRTEAPDSPSPSESDVARRRPIRKPATSRIAAPGGFRADTRPEPTRSPTNPPASSPPPKACGLPNARCASGAAVRTTSTRPRPFVPADSSGLPRKRDQPSRQERERHDEGGEPEELEAPVRERRPHAPGPVAGADAGVVHGREERRVVRVVRDEGRDEQEAGGREQDAEELVAAPLERAGRLGGAGGGHQRTPANAVAGDGLRLEAAPEDEQDDAQNGAVGDERRQAHRDDHLQEKSDGEVPDHCRHGHPDEIGRKRGAVRQSGPV